MATPSLAMIPSAYADSKVYSVLPNNGDGDFTFNRDSSATRVGQNGLIQTVGYFGSELVTNGDFATDSDWTLETGWTISGGTANFSGGTGNKAMYQAAGITNGKTYKIQYEVSSISAGQVAVRFGGMSGVDEITATTIGTYTGYITATGSANGNIHIEDNNNNFVGSIDNVSVQEVLGDQPRLNYDISNGVVQSCPSLLLEPASTNLLTYSEDFSQYSQTNITVADNNSTSPEGIVNSSKLTDDSTNGNHRIFLSHTTTAASHTFSIFMKKGTMTTAFLRFLSGSDIAGANVDLESGTISATVGTAKIEAYPNDWYKCSITGTAVSGTSYVYVYMKQLTGYSGTSQDMFVFGAQVEALSYASSYIPTDGSSQTRAAETCNDAGTASTFNSTEGVLYAEIESFISQDTVDPNRYITITNGTSNERVAILFGGNNNQLRAIIFSSSQSINLSFTTSLTEVKQFNKLALRYKSGDYAFYVNGVEIGSSTESTIFSSNILNDLSFDVGGGSLPFYGKCKDLRVYNEALTDAQLQTLTTL